jgi:uncharacterized membrane protein YfhO
LNVNDQVKDLRYKTDDMVLKLRQTLHCSQQLRDTTPTKYGVNRESLIAAAAFIKDAHVTTSMSYETIVQQLKDLSGAHD